MNLHKKSIDTSRDARSSDGWDELARGIGDAHGEGDVRSRSDVGAEKSGRTHAAEVRAEQGDDAEVEGVSGGGARV